MAESRESCIKPSAGPIAAASDGPSTAAPAENYPGGAKMIARVGKPAPDFEATAFIDGGFRNIRLSEYKGKWIVLCFYPGDFTFV
jgi:hypothetical protein